eukprot:jgi/Bigna1/82425/fgenesh1_pg.92_\
MHQHTSKPATFVQTREDASRLVHLFVQLIVGQVESVIEALASNSSAEKLMISFQSSQSRSGWSSIGTCATPWLQGGLPNSNLFHGKSMPNEQEFSQTHDILLTKWTFGDTYFIKIYRTFNVVNLPTLETQTTLTTVLDLPHHHLSARRGSSHYIQLKGKETLTPSLETGKGRKRYAQERGSHFASPSLLFLIPSLKCCPCRTLETMYDDGMDELEKTGFLFKRGKASKVDPKPAWKKRWFELDLHSKQLKYYKHQSDISTKGDIPISGAILRILRPTEKLWRPRAFAISGPHTKREYFLQAKTQEDMEEWLKAITDAVNYLAETDRKNQMPETTGDLKSSAPLGGSNNPENMKKEEVKINLNLALPKTFFPLMSRMNAWRSVAALRGYVDHELVVETRTLERDLVPYTSCLAVRRGSNVTPDTGFFATGNSNPDSNRSPVTFFYPGTMQKETLRAEALRTDVTASCRCTDIDWRDNKLLCGTSAGQLRLYVTGVMGDGISVVKTRTIENEYRLQQPPTLPGVLIVLIACVCVLEEKKDYAKMKVAEYGEWGISQRISQCELNPKK